MVTSVSVERQHGTTQSVEDLEIDLLLEGVARWFGQDFRGYLREPLRRRLQDVMQQQGVDSVSALQARVMHAPEVAELLLRALFLNHSSLFGEPAYYRVLRERVVPWLRATPSPRIWVAECVTLEDVCGVAILLAEEGLQDKTQIFATAALDTMLQEARRGEFSNERLVEYAANYRQAGGRGSLRDYVEKTAGRVRFSDALLNNVVWAQHSLVTDASFNEFQLIVCRRAFAQFGATLRSRALELFRNSLPMLGMLALPPDQTQSQALLSHCFKPLEIEQGLYQRVC